MRKGYILLELLLSLALSLSIIPLSNTLILTLYKIKVNSFQSIDMFEVQFYQLLIHSNIKQIREDSIDLTHFQKDFVVALNNHRIVKQPGYEILLDHVSQLEFKKSYERLEVRIVFNNEEYSISYEI